MMTPTTLNFAFSIMANHANTNGAPALDVRNQNGRNVVNLLRVPGPHQVLLKVRIAELNRTAFRQIGGDFLAIDPESGAILGTQIGGAGVTATALAPGRKPL